MPEEERMLHKSAHADDDELDLWEMAQVLWKRRLVIAAVTSVGTIASAIIAFTQPNIYTATASIMPVDSSSDRMSTALSSLGALGGLASQAGVGLKGTVSDKFVVLLKSRTLSENVIIKHNLLPVLFSDQWDPQNANWKKNDTPTMHDALRQIKEIVTTKTDPKAGIVEISVEHTNPQVAADIANYYIIELSSYLRGNSFTTAQQNKEFLEKQLQTSSNELRTVENKLKTFQENHKLISLDAQAQASVQAYSTLKAQLMAKEMEINLQKNSTSESDIQLIGLKQEASQLQEKLTSLENGASGGLVSFKDAPRLAMMFAQLTRDLLIRQKVFELITQQYELSKIEEAKEALTFQIIDKAIPADKKSKPKRLVNIAISSIIFLFLGGGIALFLDNARERLDRRDQTA